MSPLGQKDVALAGEGLSTASCWSRVRVSRQKAIYQSVVLTFSALCDQEQIAWDKTKKAKKRRGMEVTTFLLARGGCKMAFEGRAGSFPLWRCLCSLRFSVSANMC